MRTTDRLTLALLKQRIIQARAQMREACRLVNYDQAVVAERGDERPAG